MNSAMVTALGPVLGAGVLLGALASCSSTGKVKDEGAYTTTGKAVAKETDGSKSAGATVGGSVGVYTEVGNTSRSVR
jgi:hypothetical protein